MSATPNLREIACGPRQATLEFQDGLRMRYYVDDFTDPWSEPSTVVLLHGVAEASVAWYGWIPHLSRQFRVVRPDMRGFGDSSPMPLDHVWSLDQMADDLQFFFSALGLGGANRPHLVAAKVGGMVALHFAARYPDALASLSVVGTPVRGADVTKLPGYGADVVLQEGVGKWASNGQAARLGSALPPAGHAWWTDMMERTPRSTQAGFLQHLHGFDATPALPNIACPTLVVTNRAPEGTPPSITSESATRLWQQRIPHSQLLLIDSDAYHVAAGAPDRTALGVRAFIESVEPGERHPGKQHAAPH